MFTQTTFLKFILEYVARHYTLFYNFFSVLIFLIYNKLRTFKESKKEKKQELNYLGGIFAQINDGTSCALWLSCLAHITPMQYK